MDYLLLYILCDKVKHTPHNTTLYVRHYEIYLIHHVISILAKAGYQRNVATLYIHDSGDKCGVPTNKLCCLIILEY